MPIEFRYRDVEGNLMLYIDYDFNKPPFCFMSPHEAYELARLDSIRLKQMFRLGKLVMKRSDGGAMAMFPEARLTPEEIESILCQSLVDRGYYYYTVEKGGLQTLRTSPKVIVVEDRRGRRLGRRVEGREPQVWEIL